MSRHLSSYRRKGAKEMAGERAKPVWRAYWEEYRKAGRKEKTGLLDEFCRRTGYDRKYAIVLLNGPPPEVRKGTGQVRRRKKRYPGEVFGVLAAVWEAAGYPWSVRLKAMLPLVLGGDAGGDGQLGTRRWGRASSAGMTGPRRPSTGSWPTTGKRTSRTVWRISWP